MKSKRTLVRELLSDLCWHTCDELAEVGGKRYSARLHELKRLGFDVESQTAAEGKNYRFRSRQPGPPKTRKVKVYLPEQDANALMQGNVTAVAMRSVRESLDTYDRRKGSL